ncbi:MAG: hypothetical protein AAF585_13730, partial [Verrucomicrobiota bacterium]
EMKGFIVTVLILGILGGGGWYAYNNGYLDSIIGAKSGTDRGGVAAAPAAPAPAPKPDTDTSVATAPDAPEPKAAPAAPAEEPLDPELEAKINAQVPMPDFLPLMKIVDNWNNVPKRAFPKTVTVNVEVEYGLEVDGKKIGSSKAPAGHKAVPLAQKPGYLQISNRPDGSTKAVVKIDDTDFKSQIETLYNTKVGEIKERVIAARKVAREVLARPQEEGDPEQLANGWHDSMDPRFKPVRDYLASGKLESGILEEAKDWRWLGSENHGGSSYDVVLVHFEVNTIFGMFPNTMKCLLRNGKVEKWVDAETGEERT